MPLKLKGATSGDVTVSAPAVAGTTSLILPKDSIQPGLVLITEQSFSAAATVSVNNCFTSTYENYRLMLTHVLASGVQAVNLRLRASGVDDSTANYAYQYSDGTNTTLSASRATGQTKADFGASSTGSGWQVVDLFRPALAAPTFYVSLNGTTVTAPFVTTYVGGHNVSSVFDGITIYPTSSTFTGTVRIYAYRNSIQT